MHVYRGCRSHGCERVLLHIYVYTKRIEELGESLISCPRGFRKGYIISLVRWNERKGYHRSHSRSSAPFPFMGRCCAYRFLKIMPTAIVRIIFSYTWFCTSWIKVVVAIPTTRSLLFCTVSNVNFRGSWKIENGSSQCYESRAIFAVETIWIVCRRQSQSRDTRW